jgi:hypothetical protein
MRCASVWSWMPIMRSVQVSGSISNVPDPCRGRAVDGRDAGARLSPGALGHRPADAV